MSRAKVERVNQGRRRSEADLRGSLTNEQDDKQGDAADAPAEGEAKKTEPAAEKSDKSTAQDDYQLARALDLLRGLQLLSSTVVN